MPAPVISAPPPAPSRAAPSTFSARMDAFLAWIVSFVSQVNAFGSYLNTGVFAQILGTVSESAGVPTGAVIERGSNANGEYVRFADGTQICTRTLLINAWATDTTIGSVFRGSVGGYTFPAAFTSCDHVNASVVGSQDGGVRNNLIAAKFRTGSTVTSTTDWQGLSLWSALTNPATAGAITRIDLFAIGRWF